jgi:hypothetical protein
MNELIDRKKDGASAAIKEDKLQKSKGNVDSESEDEIPHHGRNRMDLSVLEE